MKQHGSVLVISLLILLVLTLIGVTSMSTTSLQSKMATNSRESNLAFQASESALRYGEAALSGSPSPAGYDAACDNGLCLPSTNGTPVWTSINWAASARSYSTQTATALSEIPLPLQPKYIIEKLPAASIKGNSVSNITNSSSHQYYRITALGSGANGSASVMLQSIYEP